MGNLVVLVVGALLLGSMISLSQAQEPSPKAEQRLVKSRQMQERKSLKLEQRNRKQSLRHSATPRAVRLQQKHEMQRQERELRARQKNELQDLKDRQRLVKAYQSQL